MAFMSAKNMRTLGLIGVGLSGVGLTIMPSVFDYSIFGQITTGLIFGAIDLWVAYSLWKNKM